MDTDNEAEKIPNSIVETAILDIPDTLHKNENKNLISKLRTKELLSIWGRCVCHLIQLSVQDFLAHPMCHNDTITQINLKTKMYIRSCKKLSKCSEIFLEHKFFSLMYQTRWDSMFYMIQSFLKADKNAYLKLFPNLNTKQPKNRKELF